jgi:hypothetical protein
VREKKVEFQRPSKVVPILNLLPIRATPVKNQATPRRKQWTKLILKIKILETPPGFLRERKGISYGTQGFMRLRSKV